MKLGKTSWIIIIIGVVIVAFASVGVTRSRLISEHNQINDDLSVAEKRLDTVQVKDLHSQQSELDTQLDEASSRLTAAKNAMHWPNESIDVTDFLFKIAEGCGVKLTNIQSSGLSSEKLGGINCSAIKLTIMADGDVLNLIDFVIKLNTDFTTGIVNSVDIDTRAFTGIGVTDNQTEEGAAAIAQSENVTGEERSPAANIRLTVYSYQGS